MCDPYVSRKQRVSHLYVFLVIREPSNIFVLLPTLRLRIHSQSLHDLFLKGLAMIFDGQENPFIIFRCKEMYI